MSQIIFLGTGGGGGGGDLNTLTGDTGGAISPSSGNINLVGAHGINTQGGGNTITFEINNAITLGDLSAIAFGSDALDAQTGDINIESGDLKLPLTTADTGAVLVAGELFLHNFSPTGMSVTGTNTFVGYQCGNTTLTTANQNFFGGALAAQAISTGSGNTLLGYFAGNTTLTTGVNNVWLGAYAGQNAGGDEQSTIYIGTQLSTTVPNEICTLRIGNHTGTNVGDLIQVFICGIEGVDVGSIAQVVLVNSSNQLGSAVLTAGSGISITPTSNTITIAATGAPALLPYTPVTSTPYVVQSTDYYLGVDCSSSAITVQLPNISTTGKVVIVKDVTGSALTNNITVTSVSGGTFIDGSPTFVLNANFSSAQFLYNGINYQVF